MPKAKRILKTSSDGIKRWDIFLKSPTAKSGRSSFAIIERKEGKSKTLHSEALDAINLQFSKGIIPFERAKLLAKDIIDQLRPKQAILHNQANLDLLKQYWEREYVGRDLVDRRSAYNRLVRGVEAVGHCSLLSASTEELQAEVDKLKGNKQRAAVAALKQILGFLNRDIKLRRAREQVHEVSYVTETELKKLVSHIKVPELKLMHEIAFATGLRAGELFGLLPHHVKGEVIDISTQIDIQRTRRELKNRKPRKTYILPGYEAKVLEWAAIPLEKRLAFRKRSLAKLTRSASHAALGREITFHALRHSYAIHLISKGGSISVVSKLIGDGIKVTEHYYAGYISTPEQIQLLKLQIKS